MNWLWFDKKPPCNDNLGLTLSVLAGFLVIAIMAFTQSTPIKGFGLATGLSLFLYFLAGRGDPGADEIDRQALYVWGIGIGSSVAGLITLIAFCVFLFIQ
jgi:hypothetical protein